MLARPVDSGEQCFDELLNNPKDISLVIKMSPRELANFFGILVSNGGLELFLEKVGHELSVLFYIPLFSYYQKWIKGEENRAKLDMVSETASSAIPDGELPLSLDKRFSDAELEMIFNEVFAFQLSVGCSGACPRCMFDAVPRVRDDVDFDKIKNLILKFKSIFGRTRPVFYHASDPKDYLKYPELHKFVRETCGYDPHVTTKVSNDEESLEWLSRLSQVAEDVRISIYHILDEAEITGLLDAIALRTGGVFKKGSGVFKVAGEHDDRLSLLNFLEPGLRGFYEGFGDLLVDDLFAKPYEGHTPNMGITFEKPGLNKCDGENGVFLTPRGLYNSARLLSVSEHFPQGHIIMPIIEIRDINPKKGDYLQDYMPYSVAGKARFEFPKPVDHETAFNIRIPDLPDEFRKLEVTLKAKNGSFKVGYDDNGLITKVKKVV
ncbi:MAG: hypothetical protein UT33_C0011G0173 [Candidatus Peregrinibacteria bacterium GW2011_GWC2_39_14]|nr:MAG: hypothetical protein UT33_C0011G0173 [Candidatus Peregrinibacteria bacterium GW2011_GWC2_39_14]